MRGTEAAHPHAADGFPYPTGVLARGSCWGRPLALGTGTGHGGSRTQTCGRLQLLQDGGDSQLLLLRGDTQVLVVQQLEQDAELWQELVQH